MYKCKKCGHGFEGKFCPECGEKRQETVVCPNCGKQYESKVRFCTECGYALHKEAAEQPAAETEDKPVKPVFKTEITPKPPVLPVDKATAKEEDELFGFGANRGESAEEKAVTAEPPLNTDKKLAFMLWFFSKHKWILLWLTLGGLSFCLSCLMFVLHNERVIDYYTSTFIIGAGIFGVIFLALTVFTAVKLITKSSIPNYPDILKWRKHNKSYISYAVVYPLIGICTIVGVGRSGLSGGLAAVLAFLIIYAAIFIAELISYSVFFKKIENRFIVKNADGTVVSKLTPYVLKSIEDMREDISEYARRGNAKREVAGKPPKTEHDYEKQLLIIRIACSFAAFVFTAGIFLMAAYIPRNIYKISMMERISVGDGVGYVNRLLGDYYDYKEYKDVYGNVTGGTYYYCSDPLAKTIAQKNARLKALEESGNFDDFDKWSILAAEIVELELMLVERRSNFITVTYKESTVTEINFEKDCYYGLTSERAVSTVTYSCGSREKDAAFYQSDSSKYYDYGDVITVYQNSTISSVNVRLYFTDGSLVNKTLETEIDTSVAGVQTLQWIDGYGKHDLQVVVKR